MARKRWEDLSASYRRRLERSGITAREHRSGRGSLARARGHAPTAPSGITPTELELLQIAQKYGPKDAEGIPLLALENIRADIQATSYRQMRDRLYDLRRKAKAHASGKKVFDPRRDKRRFATYRNIADEDTHGRMAYYYWYHGPITP